MKSILRTRELTFSYPEKKPLFENLNLEIKKGEWVIVKGASGSGKSTLLHCLCGLVPRFYKGELTGDIFLDDKIQSTYKKGELPKWIGMVFQNNEGRFFFPTIEEEIWFGLQNLCLPKEEIVARTEEALECFKIEHLRSYHPASLSGGQKQLVAFAILYAMRPQIYCLDEALTQLDGLNRKGILQLLQELQKEGTTILMIEHDESLETYAQQMIVLGGKEYDRNK